jgi:Metallo-beta-lactamase superfamily
MLKLAMLPARQGDCLWITYGREDASHHLVIDGGPEKAGTLRSHIHSRMAASADRKLHIDLLVVTHVDNDHIGGVLEVLERLPSGLTIGEVWFNAYRHLLPPDRLGPDQGDRLSEALDRLQPKVPWNVAFNEGPIVIPDQGELPHRTRQDGLTITVLGPERSQLARLEPVWRRVVADEMTEEGPRKRQPEDLLGRDDPWPPDIAALAQQRFRSDTGEANGSSIALLVEYEGKRILCAADAHAVPLASALGRLPDEEERIRLSAFKLSHHGSRKSTSSELLKRVACNRYLISTNGSYFGHPDPEAIARVLVNGGKNPSLIFNYDVSFTNRWKKGGVKDAPTYGTIFPAGTGKGLEVAF